MSANAGDDFRNRSLDLGTPVNVPGRSIEAQSSKMKHRPAPPLVSGERCIAVVEFVAEKRTGFQPSSKNRRGSDSEKRVGMVTNNRRWNPVVSSSSDRVLRVSSFQHGGFRGRQTGLHHSSVASITGLSRHGCGEAVEDDEEFPATLNAMGSLVTVVLWWRSGDDKHVHMRFQSRRLNPITAQLQIVLDQFQ